VLTNTIHTPLAFWLQVRRLSTDETRNTREEWPTSQRGKYTTDCKPLVDELVHSERQQTGLWRLLPYTTLRRYTLIGGLLTLPFAQRISRIVAMRVTQISVTDDGAASVTFGTILTQITPILSELIHDHVEQRGKSLYASRDAGWLFPGGSSGSTSPSRTSVRSSSRSASRPIRIARPRCFTLRAT
jgi:hypothetical protein